MSFCSLKVTHTLLVYNVFNTWTNSAYQEGQNILYDTISKYLCMWRGSDTLRCTDIYWQRRMVLGQTQWFTFTAFLPVSVSAMAIFLTLYCLSRLHLHLRRNNGITGKEIMVELEWSGAQTSPCLD